MFAKTAKFRRLLSVCLFPALLSSGSNPAFAQNKDLGQDRARFELFGGFSQYHAGATIENTKVPDFKSGWAGQFALNCNPNVRLVLDLNGHNNDYANSTGFALGTQFTRRIGRFAPFAEIMTGLQNFGPKKLPSQNSATYILGGGLDFKLTRRISVRPIQLDYVKTYYNANSPSFHPTPLNGFRDQAGIVYALSLPEVPSLATAACSAKPESVEPGSPIDVSVTASRFRHRHLTYSYKSTGGVVTGNAESAKFDTTGLAPGSYTVTAKVTDGRRSHAEAAACQVALTVVAPPKHDPSLEVKTETASVTAGSPSTITLAGTSPDNHPLTYQCSASSGSLTGSGTTFTLDTAGVPAGSVSINCTATDDRNLVARARTSVEVKTPAAPAVAQNYGAIAFKHDPRRPTRVDNEAKGLLDRFGDALAAAPDAKAIIIGYATTEEAASKTPVPFAAQRAANTKDYLVTGKGIDPARVEPRTASDSDQKVELWILSPGSTLPVADTKLVDESKVKAVPRAALPQRKAVHPRKQVRRHAARKGAKATSAS